MMNNPENSTETGAQRLSLDQLRQWEALKFGMFIHFGMSTYDGDELSKGDMPATTYAPDRLDVDQWTGIARDAGMKYAVLTAKHVAGHCLWPSQHTDYHVGNSGNSTDVVDAFVTSCEKRGILPGLYYCAWDNHHTFGSLTPTAIEALPKSGNAFGASKGSEAYTTRAYQDFQSAQIEELLTRYGKIAEVWIDIPGVLPRGYRHDLYRQIAELQPEAVIVMNHGIGDGSEFNVPYAWPTEVIVIERFLPNSQTGHVKWREIEGKRYYLPAETCDPIGKEWFFTEADQPRSDGELLGMYLTATNRGSNFVLNIGPDKHGLIQEKYARALQRLRKNLDLLNFAEE